MASSSASDQGSHSDFEDNDYELEEKVGDDDNLFEKFINFDAEWLPNAEKRVINEDLNQSEEEDLIPSDDDLASLNGSDSEGEGTRFPSFNPVHIFNPHFALGMVFSTKSELRKTIHSHAINTKRNIKITKNDKMRMHAKCTSEECKWKLHALKLNDEETFQIRAYASQHTCVPSYKVKNLTSSWLSAKYAQRFNSDPTRKAKGFRADAMDDIRVQISNFQAYRAKKLAVEALQGNADEQYSLLWNFAEEVKRTNPGSIIIIDSEIENGKKRFDRAYLCLQALKDGFVGGCRPFIGVDGCHLKGPHGGVLLTAVGVDPNNNIFPLAVAAVSKENKDTWEWFLILLKLDLKLQADYEYTFMSDKQKGLIQAFDAVFPNVEHRFCVRHLHSNFSRAGWRGQAYKTALWNAARATTVPEFVRKMEVFKEMKESSFTWFNDKPPCQWSRSHFSDISKCDMLLNNGCESFNSNILEAREKPIVSMFEWLVEYLMSRMQKNRDRATQKWRGDFCPKIQQIIQKNQDAVGGCFPTKSDEFHYSISCSDENKYSVDLKNWSCACRKWDLTGIPCCHALCAIYAEGKMASEFTHNCYRLETYRKVYEPVILPVNGRSEWLETGIETLAPPNNGRGVGRPGGARRREPFEDQERKKKRGRGRVPNLKNSSVMKRQQATVKCSVCGVEGHNKRRCQGSSANAKTKLPQKSQRDEVPEMVEEMTDFDDFFSQLTQEHAIEPAQPVVANQRVLFPLFPSSSSSRPALSMFDQFKQSQTAATNVEHSYPASFVGGHFIPSVERCITKQSMPARPIFHDEGNKYVSFNDLNVAVENSKKKLLENKKP